MSLSAHSIDNAERIARERKKWTALYRQRLSTEGVAVISAFFEEMFAEPIGILGGYFIVLGDDEDAFNEVQERLRETCQKFIPLDKLREGRFDDSRRDKAASLMANIRSELEALKSRLESFR